MGDFLRCPDIFLSVGDFSGGNFSEEIFRYFFTEEFLGKCLVGGNVLGVCSGKFFGARVIFHRGNVRWNVRVKIVAGWCPDPRAR